MNDIAYNTVIELVADDQSFVIVLSRVIWGETCGFCSDELYMLLWECKINIEETI